MVLLQRLRRDLYMQAVCPLATAKDHLFKHGLAQ